MNTKQKVPGYMVQLDGLRAIAVLMVIFFHWTPEVKNLALGGLGVQLFFVLSGFLITGILVDARAKAETIGAGKAQIIKSFYARRFLRIFPLYYLVILLTAILGAYNVVLYLPWHLAYLTNIAIFLDGNWIGEASHLWSLAVEEQFYLLWPFVILFTPSRFLTGTVLGFILLAPLFKLGCIINDVGGSRIGVLPISSFHYLGAGALLAILERKSKLKENAAARWPLATRVQLAGIIGFVIFATLRAFPHLILLSPFVTILQEFAVICLFVSLTMGAAYGFKGTAGKILSSKPMVYIGQISYGLYLIHNFVPYFTSQLFLNFFKSNAPAILGSGGVLLFNSVVLVLLSSFFWHVMESRLNKYKNHFPYVKANAKLEKVITN